MLGFGWPYKTEHIALNLFSKKPPQESFDLLFNYADQWKKNKSKKGGRFIFQNSDASRASNYLPASTAQPHELASR